MRSESLGPEEVVVVDHSFVAVYEVWHFDLLVPHMDRVVGQLQTSLLVQFTLQRVELRLPFLDASARRRPDREVACGNGESVEQQAILLIKNQASNRVSESELHVPRIT